METNFSWMSCTSLSLLTKGKAIIGRKIKIIKSFIIFSKSHFNSGQWFTLTLTQSESFSHFYFFFSGFHIFILRKKNVIFIYSFDLCLSFQLHSFLIKSQLSYYFSMLILPSSSRWKKTVYIGDYHSKSNVHAGKEKHQLLLKSTILTSKETAETKTNTNRNFTAKAYNAYTPIGSSASSRMSLTTELQWFQTLSFCNVSPSWQCNTPTQDHKSNL